MALMDEFKKERQAVLHGPFKQKLLYFWHYYKWPAIITIFVMTFTVQYIYALINKPEPLLHGIALNTSPNKDFEDGQKIIDDFADRCKIDTSKYSLVLESNLYYQTASSSKFATSNYEAMQVMMARSATGELDYIIGDLDSLVSLAYSEFFSDLSTLLIPEKYAFYETTIYYIDEAIVEKMKAADWNTEYLDISIPDPQKPEEMQKPIPVLIDISQSDKLNTIYDSNSTSLVYGIVNAEEPETTLQFLDYLLQDN